MIDLFPGVLSRSIPLGETGIKVNWIGIRSERLTSDVSKMYHRGRTRRFGKNDTPYALTKDGAFGCRRTDVVCLDDSGERKPHISELKKLQGYPDRIKFMGSYVNKWERIGNSVPPLLMKAIATQIRHKLWNGEPLTRYPKSMTYPEILEAAWQDHLKPKEPDAPTVISTFAGGGGSSLGYSMAGYRELLAVEWDNNAVETFKLNFPNVPVYHGDIAELSVEECMELAGLSEPGELDLFDGSPPCQGFSSAGKRILNDPRNQLFREYVRLLRGLKPKVFVMENVPGLVKGKMKLVFAEIMRELKASGYQVRCKKLNAMYFYVPQSRERLIFIGVRDDLAKGVSFPGAESRAIAVNEILPSVNGKMITWRNRGGNHTKIDFSNPSPTIDKAGGHIEVNGNRCPWPIYDQLKLQGIPGKFFLVGNNSQKRERIGNSVPPLFMRSIAEHIRKTIFSIEPELIG